MPSKTIKIGVASAFMYPDPQRGLFEKKTLCYIEKDMARYLHRENVLPVLIPDLACPSLENFLKALDGFVFQGGTNIAPATYGEQAIDKNRWPGDPYRDAFELKVLEFALKNQRPILGICRGFELLNVYFGGTLYQDIPTQNPQALRHRDGELYDQLNHPIEFVESSLLARLYQEDPVRQVNSVHHQGIKTLGRDLEVLAHCPQDGLVEAFQFKGTPEGRVLGVQWHPEFFYNSKTPLIPAEPVYDQFLSFCG